MYTLSELKQTVVQIGKRGESGAVIQFDLTDWLADNPAGTAAIHAIRPTESEDDSYVAASAMNGDGTTLEWTVADAETEIAGKGLAEVYLTAAGLVQIYPFHTLVEYAIGDTSGVLTDPRILTTAGDMLYYSTQPARLAIGANGYVLSSNGTAPTWIANPAADAAAMFLAAHPVGSIYMSISSTNPGTTYGGTWTAWGAGRVPVGVNAADADFNTVQETGGTKTHTHTVTGAAQITAQAADALVYMKRVTTDSWTNNIKITGAANTVADTSSTGTLGAYVTGTAAAGSSLQPYITCYMWRRDA